MFPGCLLHFLVELWGGNKKVLVKHSGVIVVKAEEKIIEEANMSLFLNQIKIQERCWPESVEWVLLAVCWSVSDTGGGGGVL